MLGDADRAIVGAAGAGGAALGGSVLAGLAGTCVTAFFAQALFHIPKHNRSQTTTDIRTLVMLTLPPLPSWQCFFSGFPFRDSHYLIERFD